MKSCKASIKQTKNQNKPTNNNNNNDDDDDDDESQNTDLQANDVGTEGFYVIQDALLPVLPTEGPNGTVAVLLASAVLVAQYVVAHDGEGC